MNNERNNPDYGHDDPLVSETYRDLANERPSDTLDRSILRQATTAAKPSYLRSMSWMRPTAWAATIGLCFAIALEVTQVQSPESAVFNSAADTVDLRTSEDRKREDANSVELHEEKVLQNKPTRQAESDSELAKTDFPAAAKAPARVQPAEKKRVDESELLSGSSKASVPSVADEFIINDADMMRDAEDFARAQSGNKQEIAPAVRTRSLSAATLAIVPSSSCDKEATSTPTTWVKCITDLENAGQSDEVDRQRAQLKLAFPNFELP